MKIKLKKLLPLIMLCILIWSSRSIAGPISIYNENIEVNVEPKPFVEKGRILVPIRFIGEMFGSNVYWDNTAKAVTINKGLLDTKLTIGNKTAELKGYDSLGEQHIREDIELDVPARIIDGSTFVPLRFIGENMNIVVKWDGTTNSIYLSSHDPENNKAYNKNTYTNGRFGYRVEYPEEWNIYEESQNGDGCYLYKDEDVQVLVYGSFLMEDVYKSDIHLSSEDVIHKTPMNIPGSKKAYKIADYYVDDYQVNNTFRVQTIAVTNDVEYICLAIYKDIDSYNNMDIGLQNKIEAVQRSLKVLAQNIYNQY